jgi:hypothetical protein
MQGVDEIRIHELLDSGDPTAEPDIIAVRGLQAVRCRESRRTPAREIRVGGDGHDGLKDDCPCSTPCGGSRGSLTYPCCHIQARLRYLLRQRLFGICVYNQTQSSLQVADLTFVEREVQLPENCGEIVRGRILVQQVAGEGERYLLF